LIYLLDIVTTIARSLMAYDAPDVDVPARAPLRCAACRAKLIAPPRRRAAAKRGVYGSAVQHHDIDTEMGRLR